MAETALRGAVGSAASTCRPAMRHLGPLPAASSAAATIKPKERQLLDHYCGCPAGTDLVSYNYKAHEAPIEKLLRLPGGRSIEHGMSTNTGSQQAPQQVRIARDQFII